MNHQKPFQDSVSAALLFTLLLGVYMLVYVPTLDSIDAEALLALPTSLTTHQAFDISAVGADDALLPYDKARMGSFGVDGVYYSKKGLTPSLALLPFVALSNALPWLDTRATAMLLNPLVTAATAAFLYLFLRRLSYTARTALIVTLIYGLASLPLPYVQTLYGEPLAALLLLVAVAAIHDYQQRHRSRVLHIAGLSIALLVGVNLIYGLALVVVSVYVLWLAYKSASPPLKSRWFAASRQAIPFFIPVLVGLTLLGVYNFVRFGSPLTTGYGFGVGEGFTTPPLKGLFGLSLSFYRGLIWFSPALVFALFGWFPFRRRWQALAWLALALVILQWITFAMWSSWEGGIVWGPRFLIPIIPLLAIMLAPVVDKTSQNRSIATILTLLVALSAIVQVVGVAFDIFLASDPIFVRFYDVARDAMSDSILTDPAASSILANIQLLLQGTRLHPAWLSGGVDGFHLLAAGFIVGAGVYLGIRRARIRLWDILISLAAVLLGLNIIVARQQRGDSYQQIRSLEDALQPPGIVMVASTVFGQTLLDLEGQSHIFSTNAPTTPDDRLARAMWNAALQQRGNWWLVNWHPPADGRNWQEQYLFENLPFAFERSAAGHRLLLFYNPPADFQMEDQPSGYDFGVVQLQRYAVQNVPEGLIVRLKWRASDTPAGNYAWFVHVLDAGGNTLAQQDRPPQGGYAPTSMWSAGQIVTDQLYFPGVHDWAALRIGWIDPASGQHLPTFDADGTPIPDGFVIIHSSG